jgi:hypothetical protein
MADEIPPEIALEVRLRSLEQRTQKLIGHFADLGADLAALRMLIPVALHRFLSTASDPTAALRELAHEVSDAFDSLSQEQIPGFDQARQARTRATVDAALSDVAARLANDANRGKRPK